MEEIENLFDKAVAEIERMLNSKTVVGEPITIQDNTLIPLINVGFGFGVGAGKGTDPVKGAGQGGGTGGGGDVRARRAKEEGCVAKGDNGVTQPVCSVGEAEGGRRRIPVEEGTGEGGCVECLDVGLSEDGHLVVDEAHVVGVEEGLGGADGRRRITVRLVLPVRATLPASSSTVQERCEDREVASAAVARTKLRQEGGSPESRCVRHALRQQQPFHFLTQRNFVLWHVRRRQAARCPEGAVSS